tara:strand:- start:1405 stop:2139 length:735 start_codon:yes stop_codon:yes gene_type:complete
MENFLNIILAAEVVVPTDLVGFTFWLGAMAMAAASVFFLLSLDAGGGKWRNSILVSALITGIAAVHYIYMRDAHAAGDSTTAFRYVDWILTVPLMCVEFYLILAKAGATKKLMWNLIGLSTLMLVTGYFGEAGSSVTGLPGDAVVWGTLSGLAYFVIVYILWFGEASALATKAGGAVLDAYTALKWFVLVGWAIYPIGYMAGTEGYYNVAFGGLKDQMDTIYNIGDAINKIGFGLVIYNLAVSK